MNALSKAEQRLLDTLDSLLAAGFTKDELAQTAKRLGISWA